MIPAPFGLDSLRRAAARLWVAPKPALFWAFTFIVFPLGLNILYITPPGQVADEPAHLVRADALLHGAFIGSRQPQAMPDGRTVMSAGVHADPAIVWSCFIFAPPAMNRSSLAQKSNLPWTGTEPFLQIDPLAIYAPVFYIPSAIGLGLGKMLGEKPYAAVYVARLVSYLCFCLAGGLALLLARRGQAMIFVTLAIPMGLSLGASSNPDGLLIATSTLAAALISRGCAKAGNFFLSLMLLVKPPYALLTLPSLFPLPAWQAGRAQYRALLKRAGWILLAVLPGVLWFSYAMITTAEPTQRPAYHPGPLWPGNPALTFYSVDPRAQLTVILSHPLRYLVLFWHSLQSNRKLLTTETIGLLGWLNLPLVPNLYHIWMIAFPGAIVADVLNPNRPGPSPLETCILLAGIAITLLLVWTSQYLDWTNVGLAEIDGPSGRYLLPLFPMLGLALPRLSFKGAWLVRRAALCLPVLAALITLLLLPRWLAIQFYIT